MSVLLAQSACDRERYSRPSSQELTPPGCEWNQRWKVWHLRAHARSWRIRGQYYSIPYLIVSKFYFLLQWSTDFHVCNFPRIYGPMLPVPKRLESSRYLLDPLTPELQYCSLYRYYILEICIYDRWTYDTKRLVLYTFTELSIPRVDSASHEKLAHESPEMVCIQDNRNHCGVSLGKNWTERLLIIPKPVGWDIVRWPTN